MGCWVRVCATEDIDEEDLVRWDHDGRSFAIYNTEAGFFATDFRDRIAPRIDLVRDFAEKGRAFLSGGPTIGGESGFRCLCRPVHKFNGANGEFVGVSGCGFGRKRRSRADPFSGNKMFPSEHSVSCLEQAARGQISHEGCRTKGPFRAFSRELYGIR